MKPATLFLLAIFTLAAAGPVQASSHTVRECREGADFIRNAAHSRNNGQSKEVFLDRLNGDLSMIRAMPLGLRWFVRDQADELLLTRNVERVYDNPLTPEAHESAFLGECGKNIEEGQGRPSI